MSEQDKKPQAEDQVATSPSESGAKIPSLDRLAQVANDMTQLEWKLLKANAKIAGTSE